jgi:hypothetical protein
MAGAKLQYSHWVQLISLTVPMCYVTASVANVPEFKHLTTAITETRFVMKLAKTLVTCTFSRTIYTASHLTCNPPSQHGPAAATARPAN